MIYIWINIKSEMFFLMFYIGYEGKKNIVEKKIYVNFFYVCMKYYRNYFIV